MNKNMSLIQLTSLETIENPCTSYILTTTLEKNTETFSINPYGKE